MELSSDFTRLAANREQITAHAIKDGLTEALARFDVQVHSVAPADHPGRDFPLDTYHVVLTHKGEEFDVYTDVDLEAKMPNVIQAVESALDDLGYKTAPKEIHTGYLTVLSQNPQE